MGVGSSLTPFYFFSTFSILPTCHLHLSHHFFFLPPFSWNLYSLSHLSFHCLTPDPQYLLSGILPRVPNSSFSFHFLSFWNTHTAYTAGDIWLKWKSDGDVHWVYCSSLPLLARWELELWIPTQPFSVSYHSFYCIGVCHGGGGVWHIVPPLSPHSVSRFTWLIFQSSGLRCHLLQEAQAEIEEVLHCLWSFHCVLLLDIPKL